MSMSDNYDVIIIGSGAGGGTLAHALAGSGKRILLLERGDFLPREMDNHGYREGVLQLAGRPVSSSPAATEGTLGPGRI